MLAPNDFTGIASLIVLVWVKLEQWYIARNAKKAALKVKEAADTVQAELQVSNDETKQNIKAIKSMLNGERLSLLKEKADALSIVADLRNAPGDVEAYERAVQEYHRLKQTQAIFLAKAVQVQLDEQELEDFKRGRWRADDPVK